MQNNTRTATDQDFKQGQVLLDSSRNEFTIVKQAYSDDKDMWIARGERGEKVLFVSEARYYTVKN